ncbi:MAG: hypothetical protein R3E58_20845 [Phycisphaerae bacterium]
MTSIPAEAIECAKLLARTQTTQTARSKRRARALATEPAAIDVLMAIYKHQNRPDAIVEEFESAIKSGDTSPRSSPLMPVQQLNRIVAKRAFA